MMTFSSRQHSATDKTSLINLLAVKWYGETEFWAALGKGTHPP